MKLKNHELIFPLEKYQFIGNCIYDYIYKTKHRTKKHPKDSLLFIRRKICKISVNILYIIKLIKKRQNTFF